MKAFKPLKICMNPEQEKNRKATDGRTGTTVLRLEHEGTWDAGTGKSEGAAEMAEPRNWGRNNYS